MRRIPVFSCLLLLVACANGRTPAAPVQPQRTAQASHAKASPKTRANPPAPPASKPELDPVREQMAREQQQEEQDDAALREAQRLFQQFIARAGDDPQYAEAVQRSRERIADIDEILRFRAEGRLERAGSSRAR
jgi:hypothetical protein